jgi:hypothetical protein
MAEGRTEKASGGRFARVTRKTDEGRERGRGRARPGHGAKHVRRFIAGLAVHRVCVSEGRLKLDLGCYQPAVPDRFKVEIATRRATSPAHEEPSQRNNDAPKIRPQLPFVVFTSSWANFLGLLLSPTLRIQASLRDAVPTDPGTRR